MTHWGYAPIILVFADSEGGATAASKSVEAAGGRLAASVDINTATKRLDDQVAVDLVWIDIASDHGPMLDRLLDRVAEDVRREAYSAMVVIPPELVDIVSARIGGEGVSIVVGRNQGVIDAALTERLLQPALQLREDGGEEAAGFRRFSQPERFDRTEAPSSPALLRDGARAGGDDGLAAPVVPGPGDAGLIRDIIRGRRLRDELFGAGLFADPAWDMLLDLMAARLEGRSVAVSSLCIAAAVPATTALRWIKQLTEEGLLRRVADPDDGRRVFIELTEHAAKAMGAYFAAVPAGSRS